MSAIRLVIRDFSDIEKVVHTTHTLGGSQQVTFLTEKGLYKVLFKSRKPIAENFKNNYFNKCVYDLYGSWSLLYFIPRILNSNHILLSNLKCPNNIWSPVGNQTI